MIMLLLVVRMKERGAGRCGGKRVIQVGLMNGSATFYSLPSSSHHDALQGGRSCAKLRMAFGKKFGLRQKFQALKYPIVLRY